MSSLYADTQRQIAALEAEVRNLADTPNISAADDAKLDAKLDELDKLRRRAEAYRTELRRDPGFDKPYTPEHRPVASFRAELPMGREARDAAHRNLDEHVAAGTLDAGNAEHIYGRMKADYTGRADEAIAVAGDPDYFTAWCKIAADPVRGHMLFTAEEAEAFRRGAVISQRAVTAIGASSGGLLVPTVVDPMWQITGAGVANPFRQFARVEQLAEGNTFVIGKHPQVSASWDGEGAEVSDDTPTITSKEITVYKAQALVEASIEAEMDVRDLAANVLRAFADARTNLEMTAFFNGNAANTPEGLEPVVNTSGSNLQVTTSGAFGAVDVYALWEALPARHRPNASFISNLSTMNAIRRFDTSGGGQFIENLRGGTPMALFGRPFGEVSAFSEAITDTSGGSLMIAGDFSKYVIVDRTPGTVVELVPHMLSTGNNRVRGVRGFYCFWRTGAGVVDRDAFRALITK